MEKTPVVVIGDSFTRGLFRFQDDLTTEGKARIKGYVLPRLSLSGYVLGPEKRYGYSTTAHHIIFHRMTTQGLKEIDYYANKKNKIKGIDVFLSFGNCDIFFDHYDSEEAINASKAGTYHESKHCSNIIDNYKKLLSDIKSKFNEPNIHIISIQGYMASDKRLLTDAPRITMNKVDTIYKPQLDFYGVRNRVLIVNDKLKNMAKSLNIDYIDINKYLWDSANNNYYGVYYDYDKDDFHTNEWAIREIIRMESPLFEKLLKSDEKTLNLIKNTEAYKINKKITGGFIRHFSIIFIIQILLFLYFIYVYQENIYNIIYNGRNTLCNSVYPSICISKG